MNYNILVVIINTIFASIVLAAVAKEFRHALQVSAGYAGLLCHKSDKVGSTEHQPEDGAS